MCNKKKSNKIVKLYICHECHDQIREFEGFTVYQNTLYCDSCYIQNLDNFDLSDYVQREVMIKDEQILANGVDLLSEVLDDYEDYSKYALHIVK